jgi:hypothetical protein
MRGLGMDLQPTADHFHALTHAGQPVTRLARSNETCCG